MKKKILLFAAVATLALAMAACGKAQTSNTPTATPEPTKEVEAITAPTATNTPAAEPTAEPTVDHTATATSTPEATATPEPTATSTPEATATPEPTATSTPTPTATPIPTATSVPTKAPEPTKAPVVEAKDFGTVVKELHTITKYADRKAYVEKLDKSQYKVEAVSNCDYFTQGDMDGAIRYEAIDSNYTGEYRLMLVTDLATGETDAWGIECETYWDGTDCRTAESIVHSYNSTVSMGISPDYDTYITEWETLNYYIDLFNPADYIE